MSQGYRNPSRRYKGKGRYKSSKNQKGAFASRAQHSSQAAYFSVWGDKKYAVCSAVAVVMRASRSRIFRSRMALLYMAWTKPKKNLVVILNLFWFGCRFYGTRPVGTRTFHSVVDSNLSETQDFCSRVRKVFALHQATSLRSVLNAIYFEAFKLNTDLPFLQNGWPRFDL